MDAEPKSLRPFVLIATAFVVMGSVAGFMVWMLAHERERQGVGERPPAGSLKEVTLHPVPFPDSVPDMERRRLTGLLDAALAGDPKRATPEEQQAVTSGVAIFPPALDRLHALSISPGFADPAGRLKVQVLDRILRKVQRRVAPGQPRDRPADGPLDESADLIARAWFRWWEERSSDAATPEAPR